MSSFTFQDIGGCGCTSGTCVSTETVMCGNFPLTSTGSFVDSNGSGSLSTTRPTVFSGYQFASAILTASGPVNSGGCVQATQSYNYYWGVLCNANGTITVSVAYRALLACCGPGNFPLAGPVLYAPVGSSNAYTIYQTETVVPSVSGGNLVISWTLPLWTNPVPADCTMPSPPASTVTFTLPIGVTCINCLTCGSSGVNNPLYITDAFGGPYPAIWNGTSWITTLCSASTASPTAQCTSGSAACNSGTVAGSAYYYYLITCTSAGNMTLNRYWYELACASPAYQYAPCNCTPTGTLVHTTSGSVAVTCGSISWSGTLGSGTGHLSDPVGGTVTFTQ